MKTRSSNEEDNDEGDEMMQQCFQRRSFRAQWQCKERGDKQKQMWKDMKKSDEERTK